VKSLEIDRYHRQVLLPQVGPEGQARLTNARVLLVGCGALGGVIAEQLARAGVGFLRIADRDLVELTNLQRQVLFDEADVRDQTPKAAAAAKRLAKINSSVTLDARVTDVHAGNIEELAECGTGRAGIDLMLDGTDNVETRCLLNDVSVKFSLPWVYGACVGTEGRCLAICPPETACLRCVFPEPPAPSELPTCDTAGVLGSAAAVIASLQVTAALRILLDTPQSEQTLLAIDMWEGRFRSVSMRDAKRPDCPTCGKREFQFLDRKERGRSASLCGRNAVQVQSGSEVRLPLLAQKLAPMGQVQLTPYLLRCVLNEPKNVKLTVFPDGRAILHGIEDLERARAIYARFVGS
jgi:adenylyltransferase/sulfurtransferase